MDCRQWVGFAATQGIPYRVITFYFLRFKGYISPSFGASTQLSP
ncbi:hypothetical protein PROSTU_01974 [Providencia stuartii ATCC 25827]|uniref:Uncharacterized protein n=1 Tax=Providencia stuartii ATCC 25827 TaxID=471874 RepID=A0AA86YVV5_PROST|nr:hypothetical protein PROSTU_01974 [Providencia stuartii ATCC 25827]